jgi:D-glycero-alpha-D-manno-heptose-7-phosphate kinase
VLYAENYGERYVVHPEQDGYDRHPLLEAAIECMHVPDDVAFQVTIFSEAPSGASTGTSAAVTVALIGALDCLTPGRLSPHEVARMAHSVEADMLGLQSGIQDQLCSAYGGINFIEMYQYPMASVSQIYVPNTIWWELESRLVLVYLGKSHHSSDVHERVIQDLEDAGPDSPRINNLRVTAEKSRDAVYAGDFDALGKAMIENTRAQCALHPDLVSEDAWRVINIAREHGALGWKVNGAGGDGGSITLLCDSLSHVKRAMIREIEQEKTTAEPQSPSVSFKSIPIYLSRYGLRVWERRLA